MTTAAEPDSVRLPLPNPCTLVVPEHLMNAQHAHLNSRYRDPVWPMAPLIEDPSQPRKSIYWEKCPAAVREELRLLAWTLINGELRRTFLKARGARMRGRVSAGQMPATVNYWFQLATWLEDRGIRALADCDRAVLHEYGVFVRDTAASRQMAEKTLISVTRLWAYDELSPQAAGLARPPWDEIGLDDYLPTATSLGGENDREPLAEETMGPLLVWAMRVIEDWADDVLAAWTEARRRREAASRAPSTTAGLAALIAYLDAKVAVGEALPATKRNGKDRLACTYIAAITGASVHQVSVQNSRRGLARVVAERPGPCPLEVPVTGRIAGTLWRDALDFNEVPVLMRHLGTAAFIVCAYLTGMRPQEVLGMRSGCCPDPVPEPGGSPGRHLIRVHSDDADREAGGELAKPHLIRSRHYKNATDEDGNHLSAGVERDVPWVAIAPVVHAIRVLERIVPEGHLLFDLNEHQFRGPRPETGSLKASAMRRRIEDFVAWVNAESLAHGLSDEVVPPDPHGAIGTARFRRSLAWHIARRPGGLVALALQYGHMRAALATEASEGYASRSRGGIHRIIDVETALAVAETAADLREHFEAGGGISGPAARRALVEAANTPRFEGREVKADFARKFLARDGAVLYENPHALLLCLYKRDRALCAKGEPRNAPTLDRCVPGCGNIVRTDQHANRLRERADALDKRAAHVPQPIGDRLRANAGQLRSYADTHVHTRTTRSKGAR
ncbi:integrase [Crossiella sp. SN42]|uniref:integrase n=1 Tax=Crossiella sp. SN42 TaxID=2944808 RepID=UPI00207D4DC3|nr:integrase [Crossiella sp. SN42]MCO1575533.1 integrase [Crossiella sp. SN42]